MRRYMILTGKFTKCLWGPFLVGDMGSYSVYSFFLSVQ